ncbi:MAG: hypothetical protein VKI81_04200 [Synechococcaceae cyanobacterium]|nr:hypothetical protein [Synechococcaceae cyanobacterium]
MPLPLAAGPAPMDLPAPAPWPMAMPDPIATLQVETFDPVGRARLIAELLPRNWNGTYSPFDGSAPRPVRLRLEAATPVGQLVDLRGRLMVGEASSPVQGTLNAKSDQLDLLVLTEEGAAGLEEGAAFQGLQGLSLSGLRTSRLTSPGGRLEMMPGAADPEEGAESGGMIRGLW